MISKQPELVPLRSTLLSFRTNFFLLLLSHSFFSPSILPQRRCRDVKLTQTNWAGIGRRGKTKRKRSHSSPKKRRSKVGWGWYQWQKEKKRGGRGWNCRRNLTGRGRERRALARNYHAFSPPPSQQHKERMRPKGGGGRNKKTTNAQGGGEGCGGLKAQPADSP